MILNNVELITENRKINIVIDNGIIHSVFDYDENFKNTYSKPALSFKDAIVFPGLINSHDHLDFNLFPQLGTKIYNNYVEWGKDIHKQKKDKINAVLNIPKSLRVQWGIYKNLLNGVTTVVNHGPKLKVEDNIISVFQDCHVLHSVQLEKYWKFKLNSPIKKNGPFAIHIGEGTDGSSECEIDELLKWNLLKRELVGIHGIAMKEDQSSKFKAIVWCPDSNYFLVGKTAAIDKLKCHVKILFGTDSTVSARWNLWEHLRLARDTKMVTDAELYGSITLTPANVWPMKDCGEIKEGYHADIVIARKKPELDGMHAFYNVNPEDILLVIHKGKISLFDSELSEQLRENNLSLNNFGRIYIKRKCKYVSGDIQKLITEIKSYYPEVNFPIRIEE